MGNRAMMLTDLFAAGTDFRRRSESVRSQGFSQNFRTVFRSRSVDQRTYARFKLGDPVAREGLNGFLSPGALQIPQGASGQHVVALIEMIPTGCCDDENLGRTATAASAADPLIAGFKDPVNQ